MARDFDKYNIHLNLSLNKNFIIFIFLLLLCKITKIECGSCSKDSKIKREGDSCFNDIIYIYGRAGQFSLRKDGVLLIEFSSGEQRIFYGLKPNGRGVFKNENTYYIVNSITKAYKSDNTPVDGRYESKNCLVSLADDISQEKQYIFSVSSFVCLAELHYFDEEFNNSHKTWTTTNFFDLEERKYIFSYQFALIEAASNIYYAAYVQYEGTYTDSQGKNHDYSISYTLSKFKFISATERTLIKTLEFNDNFDNRIVSAFMFEHYTHLAVIFLKDIPFKYILRLHDLNNFNIDLELEIYGLDASDKDIASKGEGIYFKGIYLRYEYFAIVFFTSNKDNKIKLRIYKLNKDNNNNYSLERRNKNDFGYTLDSDIRLHEFYKLDEESFLLVTSVSQNYLFFIFIDTYDWYNYINVRTYKFAMEGYRLREELSIDFYNDFLMFTASVSKDGEDYLNSFLIFFSYPNGTDFYMNISPYVENSEYYQNKNLISYLLSTRTIDNNIFDYSPIEEVKLVSIPNEIIFYREGSNTHLTNGERIGSNNVLKQDKDIIKYDRNYTLDYQFMALGKENYSSLYNSAYDKENWIKNPDCTNCNSYNESIRYIQKTYFGRTNRLTFRLCHDYCETCKELGIYNNKQKCISCLPQYKYDYYSYFNIFNQNCVPEGYFLDSNNNLVECTPENSKFYYNKTDNNKRICFDKEKECPDTYSY